MTGLLRKRRSIKQSLLRRAVRRPSHIAHNCVDEYALSDEPITRSSPQAKGITVLPYFERGLHLVPAGMQHSPSSHSGSSWGARRAQRTSAIRPNTAEVKDVFSSCRQRREAGYVSSNGCAACSSHCRTKNNRSGSSLKTLESGRGSRASSLSYPSTWNLELPRQDEVARLICNELNPDEVANCKLLNRTTYDQRLSTPMYQPRTKIDNGVQCHIPHVSRKLLLRHKQTSSTNVGRRYKGRSKMHRIGTDCDAPATGIVSMNKVFADCAQDLSIKRLKGSKLPMRVDSGMCSNTNIKSATRMKKLRNSSSVENATKRSQPGKRYNNGGYTPSEVSCELNDKVYDAKPKGRRTERLNQNEKIGYEESRDRFCQIEQISLPPTVSTSKIQQKQTKSVSIDCQDESDVNSYAEDDCDNASCPYRNKSVQNKNGQNIKSSMSAPSLARQVNKQSPSSATAKKGDLDCNTQNANKQASSGRRPMPAQLDSKKSEQSRTLTPLMLSQLKKDDKGYNPPSDIVHISIGKQPSPKSRQAEIKCTCKCPECIKRRANSSATPNGGNASMPRAPATKNPSFSTQSTSLCPSPKAGHEVISKNTKTYILKKKEATDRNKGSGNSLPKELRSNCQCPHCLNNTKHRPTAFPRDPANKTRNEPNPILQNQSLDYSSRNLSKEQRKRPSHAIDAASPTKRSKGTTDTSCLNKTQAAAKQGREETQGRCATNCNCCCSKFVQQTSTTGLASIGRQQAQQELSTGNARRKQPQRGYWESDENYSDFDAGRNLQSIYCTSVTCYCGNCPNQTQAVRAPNMAPAGQPSEDVRAYSPKPAFAGNAIDTREPQSVCTCPNCGIDINNFTGFSNSPNKWSASVSNKASKEELNPNSGITQDASAKMEQNSRTALGSTGLNCSDRYTTENRPANNNVESTDEQCKICEHILNNKKLRSMEAMQNENCNTDNEQRQQQQGEFDGPYCTLESCLRQCDKCKITAAKAKDGDAMVNLVVDDKCNVNQIIHILQETLTQLEGQKNLLSQAVASSPNQQCENQNGSYENETWPGASSNCREEQVPDPYMQQTMYGNGQPQQCRCHYIFPPICTCAMHQGYQGQGANNMASNAYPQYTQYQQPNAQTNASRPPSPNSVPRMQRTAVRIQTQANYDFPPASRAYQVQQAKQPDPAQRTVADADECNCGQDNADNQQRFYGPNAPNPAHFRPRSGSSYPFSDASLTSCADKNRTMLKNKEPTKSFIDIFNFAMEFKQKKKWRAFDPRPVTKQDVHNSPSFVDFPKPLSCTPHQLEMLDVKLKPDKKLARDERSPRFPRCYSQGKFDAEQLNRFPHKEPALNIPIYNSLYKAKDKASNANQRQHDDRRRNHAKDQHAREDMIRKCETEDCGFSCYGFCDKRSHRHEKQSQAKDNRNHFVVEPSSSDSEHYRPRDNCPRQTRVQPIQFPRERTCSGFEQTHILRKPSRVIEFSRAHTGNSHESIEPKRCSIREVKFISELNCVMNSGKCYPQEVISMASILKPSNYVCRHQIEKQDSEPLQNRKEIHSNAHAEFAKYNDCNTLQPFGFMSCRGKPNLDINPELKAKDEPKISTSRCSQSPLKRKKDDVKVMERAHFAGETLNYSKSPESKTRNRVENQEVPAMDNDAKARKPRTKIILDGCAKQMRESKGKEELNSSELRKSTSITSEYGATRQKRERKQKTTAENAEPTKSKSRTDFFPSLRRTGENRGKDGLDPTELQKAVLAEFKKRMISKANEVTRPKEIKQETSKSLSPISDHKRIKNIIQSPEITTIEVPKLRPTNSVQIVTNDRIEKNIREKPIPPEKPKKKIDSMSSCISSCKRHKGRNDLPQKQSECDDVKVLYDSSYKFCKYSYGDGDANTDCESEIVVKKQETNEMQPCEGPNFFFSMLGPRDTLRRCQRYSL